jgi:hypothetical protein
MTNVIGGYVKSAVRREPDGMRVARGGPEAYSKRTSEDHTGGTRPSGSMHRRACYS